ncbi:hypothetical protein QCA50_011582 [Cerrena zonata]|uniref:F-box domain-containing protein n=1 Tax=Cerrena zonata TaxID=2478898 RepID=A0AAW0G1J1_9APHY
MGSRHMHLPKFTKSKVINKRLLTLIWKRLTYRKPSDDSLSLAQQLPREILDIIFGYYLPRVVPCTVHPIHYDGRDTDSQEAEGTVGRLKTSDGNHTQTPSPVTQMARLPLINLALVCRTWYWAAIEHLYMYPHLHSYHQTKLLSRILEKHPHIRVIQDLAVVWDQRTSQRPDALKSIVENSPDLDAITMILQHDLDMEELWMWKTFQQVRKITVHGDRNYDIGHCSGGLHRYLEMMHSTLLPPYHVAYNLQTLQLTNVEVTEIGVWSIGLCHSLRTLEFYVTDNKPLPTHFSSAQQWTHIKHLVLGVIDGKSVSAFRSSQWNAPPNLETMTFLVDMSQQHGIFGSKYVRCWPPLSFDMIRGLQHCESLKVLTLVLQSDFRGAVGCSPPASNTSEGRSLVDGVLERGKADFCTLFQKAKRGRMVYKYDAAYTYHALLERARNSNIKTIPLWCDLSAYMNHRLSRKVDAPEIDHSMELLEWPDPPHPYHEMPSQFAANLSVPKQTSDFFPDGVEKLISIHIPT